MNTKSKWLVRTFLVVPIVSIFLGILLFSGQYSTLITPVQGALLLILPILTGCTVVYLSSYRKAKKALYQIFFPWLIYPSVHYIVLFLLGFIGKGLENQDLVDFAAKIMMITVFMYILIIPVLLLLASIGGIIGGYIVRYGGDLPNAKGSYRVGASNNQNDEAE